MASIFLSYRRDDSAGFAGRLTDDLEAALGAGSVFRDVDDIPPGEDFVRAIESHLRDVDAVLVMIGPRWLETRVDDRRRLDDPADYVRQEIVAALTSGKPIIPLLLNGATMPRDTALPEALRPLTRRQALNLADVSWKADVIRLLAAMRPLLPGVGVWRRRWPWLAGAVFLLVLGFASLSVPPNAFRSGVAPEKPMVAAVAIAGRWVAEVKYDWGVEYPETFEFQVQDGRVRGSAGFLRLPRGIEEGRLEGRQLRFVTRGDEVLGDGPPRAVLRRYEGEVEADRIHFVLETSGGYSRHPPLAFTARRVSE